MGHRWKWADGRKHFYADGPTLGQCWICADGPPLGQRLHKHLFSCCPAKLILQQYNQSSSCDEKSIPSCNAIVLYFKLSLILFFFVKMLQSLTTVGPPMGQHWFCAYGPPMGQRRQNLIFSKMAAEQ